MATSLSIPSSFKCKFDECLLGFRARIEENFQGEFLNGFVDDVDQENIRGAEDQIVADSASAEGRTVITNDTDFLYGIQSKYGIIILWGGFNMEDGNWKCFRNMNSTDKFEAIQVLFQDQNCVGEMQRVHSQGSQKIAVLSASKDENGALVRPWTWKIRDPTDEERLKWMAKKEIKDMKKRGAQT
ncbi:hypothetical protein BC937DRAFT_90006 [Endogone sp. FLAS-F59071]|nr:hypothetical protein BC937DRAFT_90006 [Endogone sp. FLAS-F59071]|eukprot:RUS17412.1 hypothetical protein BC937DRAFT_90006 [Endogone sp. FLAS-F59071]